VHSFSNDLERTFLLAISYDVAVTADVYAAYCMDLCALSNAPFTADSCMHTAEMVQVGAKRMPWELMSHGC
jgi:hypothetical protein